MTNIKLCGLCKSLLDNPTDPVRSRDCGGDCLLCMADCGDPDAIRSLREAGIELTKQQQEDWDDYVEFSKLI